MAFCFATSSERFIQRWKSRLCDLVTRSYSHRERRVTSVSSSALPVAPIRLLKRPRPGSSSLTSRSRAGRVRRLVTARASPASIVAGRRQRPPSSPSAAAPLACLAPSLSPSRSSARQNPAPARSTLSFGQRSQRPVRRAPARRPPPTAPT